eukprot:Skav221755  [mRNA]  locus=scaffold4281:7135:10214:+ [translate_table: standard]
MLSLANTPEADEAEHFGGRVADKKMPEAFEPFYHHLRHVRREELSPRRAAKRDDLTNRGWCLAMVPSPGLRAVSTTTLRVQRRRQGDFMSAAEQKADADSEHQILSRSAAVLGGSPPTTSYKLALLKIGVPPNH